MEHTRWSCVCASADRPMPRAVSVPPSAGRAMSDPYSDLLGADGAAAADTMTPFLAADPTIEDLLDHANILSEAKLGHPALIKQYVWRHSPSHRPLRFRDRSLIRVCARCCAPSSLANPATLIHAVGAIVAGADRVGQAGRRAYIASELYASGQLDIVAVRHCRPPVDARTTVTLRLELS
jgi:hypothetical protein